MNSPSAARGILPPVLLLTALLMVFAAFGFLAFGQPEETTDLIQARTTGDDRNIEILEAQLQQQRIKRTVLITCLFVGAGIAVWVAFGVMRDAGN